MTDINPSINQIHPSKHNKTGHPLNKKKKVMSKSIKYYRNMYQPTYVLPTCRLFNPLKYAFNGKKTNFYGKASNQLKLRFEEKAQFDALLHWQKSRKQSCLEYKLSHLGNNKSQHSFALCPLLIQVC